ncbi:G-protein-signaling modulator 1 [Denticeps clupeoides]|nr:G-protein-signaling modulator 1-like [Denticeps clupeoides]
MDDRRSKRPPLENGQPKQAAQEREPQLMSEAMSRMSLMQNEDFFDMIAASQSRRLDDQRASVGDSLAIWIGQQNVHHLCDACRPQELSDDFFNMLIKYQSSRIDDQRCSLPESVPGATSDPDEDFFSLVQRIQAKRMDEQRVSFYSDKQDEANSSPMSSSPDKTD